MGAGAGAMWVRVTGDMRHTHGLQSHLHAYPWAAPNYIYTVITNLVVGNFLLDT